MIKTLIFDFGDVFINLDKKGTIKRAKETFGFDIITEKPNAKNESIFQINNSYEKGLISTNEFVSFYTNLTKNISETQVINLWNSLIKNFPNYRLEFIQQLKKENKFKLILLSNTNALHIDYIKEHVSFYEKFKACFDKFYLSHEVHLRKPNTNIFEFVLNENKLTANECLFIDDTKENTEAAKKLGIHCWNINETLQDVIDLFSIKKDLF